MQFALIYDPGEVLYRLSLQVEGVAAHALSNAMLHAKGWWNPRYERSGIGKFFGV